jgi:amphi-Trp domain-containing protein
MEPKMPKSKTPKSKSKSKNDNGKASVEVAELEVRESGKSEKLNVAFESTIAREEAVAYFETLVAGLKKGKLHLKQELNEISLHPPENLVVKVKATRKRDKEKLSFEVSWRNAESSGLSISSD